MAWAGIGTLTHPAAKERGQSQKWGLNVYPEILRSVLQGLPKGPGFGQPPRTSAGKPTSPDEL